MSDLRFAVKWEKASRRGLALYLLGFAIFMPLAGVAGKLFGEYLFYKALFRRFNAIDYIGLLILLIAGILIGIYCWRQNEKRYNKIKPH